MAKLIKPKKTYLKCKVIKDAGTHPEVRKGVTLLYRTTNDDGVPTAIPIYAMDKRFIGYIGWDAFPEYFRALETRVRRNVPKD